MAVVDEMIALFKHYQEDFGLDDEENLERQCDFEDKFMLLICKHNGGHVMVQDQCGMPHHDYCVNCTQRREELGDEAGPLSGRFQLESEHPQNTSSMSALRSMRRK